MDTGGIKQPKERKGNIGDISEYLKKKRDERRVRTGRRVLLDPAKLW